MRVFNWDAPPFAIVSAERKEFQPLENEQRHANMLHWLHGAGFDHDTVTGRFEGRDECSAIVLLYDGDSGPEWEKILLLAGLYAQDAVLYVDGDRDAYLYTRDANAATWSSQKLGAWKETTAAKARESDNFTRDKFGRYYVVA